MAGGHFRTRFSITNYQATSAPFDVSSSGTIDLGVIKVKALPAVKAINVLVVDDVTGEPITGAKNVTLSSRDSTGICSGAIVTQSSSTTGKFTFTKTNDYPYGHNLSPGFHQVSADAAAWSEISSGTSSPFGSTRFPVGTPQPFTVGPGESADVSFDFPIPAGAPVGQTICADL